MICVPCCRTCNSAEHDMQACVPQAVHALPNRQCIAGGKHTMHVWRCRWLHGGQRQSSGSKCSRHTAHCRASRTSSLQRFKNGRHDTGTKLPTVVSCKLLPTGFSQSSLQLTWNPRYLVCQCRPSFPSSFHQWCILLFMHACIPSFIPSCIHTPILLFVHDKKHHALGGVHIAVSSLLYVRDIYMNTSQLQELRPVMVACWQATAADYILQYATFLRLSHVQNWLGPELKGQCLL